MGERGLQGKRSDVVEMNPETGVVVVGVDKPYEHAGPEHPRYDARVKLPIDGDDELTIATIIKHGIISPVRVSPEPHPKTGATIHVLVAGRRRTILLREARKRMRAAGTAEKDLPMLPVLPPMTGRSGWSADDLDEVQIIENEHRRDDEGLVLAEKVAVFVKRRGGDAKARKEAETTFKKSAATIDGYLKLNAASKEVKTGYAKGAFGITTAIELARAPVAEQPAKMQQAIDEAKARGETRPTAEQTREIVRPTTNKKPGEKPRVFSRALVAKVLAAEGAKEVLEGATAFDAFRLFMGTVTTRAIPGLSKLLAGEGGDAE